MSAPSIPASLRPLPLVTGVKSKRKMDIPARAMTAAAIIAAAPVAPALAQQAGSSALPSVTVDAPQQRARPAAVQATQRPSRAAAAQRRRAPRATVAAPVIAAPNPAGAGAPTVPVEADANPYAQPGVPYKVNRLASQKFVEPIVNQPRTITVLSKEVLADKGATSLRDVVRSTPGLTLGTGEGGNAFGDRILIRGFDARSDIFIDGVRDPSIGIRENFNVEQIEILKGPASSFAGRGTAGGALNLVTKKATDESFRRVDATFGNGRTKRGTIDINQVITPEWAVRMNVMGQKSGVAGRDFVEDDRHGVSLSTTFKPSDRLKFVADYTYVHFDGLPDWGVPYNRTALTPWTETGVRRSNYYGLVNRDFQRYTTSAGSFSAEAKLTDWITLNSRFRAGKSILDYVATPPESVNTSNPNPLLWTTQGNPKSRYQRTNFYTNQTDVTFKYDTGGVRNTTIAGVEYSREETMRDSYTGLASEAFPSPTTATGSYTFNLFNPYNSAPFPNAPQRAFAPTAINIDTKAAYIIHNANYNDYIIVNAGVRYDDYTVALQPPLAAIPAQQQPRLSRHDGLVNYNAGITFKPLPNGSIYAAIATSSNPVGADVDGGANDYGGLVAGNVAAGPERNTALEVGTKWEFFNQKLLATAALFQTTKDNAREQINATTVVGSGAYRIRGIELGLNGKITDDWSIYGGLVLMDSKVTKTAIAANLGKQLANVAHQSFNLMTKYKINQYFEVGGQATYISKQYGGTLAATTGNVLPSSWKFDVFADVHISKMFALKFAVYNIFDSRVYDGFYRSNVPFTYIAPGRLATVTATMKF
ncbi:catecholate siderophore receptor [Beijerinckia sp. GAS462]|nr:catecholate siderophore receptor [Beijerinckia sp. GAS462]SEB55036.1 catecholate siderophore receptor [Beijerinckia sp. 28-YEA-48]